MSDGQYLTFTREQCMTLRVITLTHTDIPPCPCELCVGNRENADLRRQLAEAQAEIHTGDYWQERAKQCFALGNCPVCNASDEAGHKKGCPWGDEVAELERQCAEQATEVERLNARLEKPQ